MPIKNIERDLNTRMSESITNILPALALGDWHRRKEMAQIMETPAIQTGLLSDRLKNVFVEIIRIDVCPIIIGEDQTPGFSSTGGIR